MTRFALSLGALLLLAAPAVAEPAAAPPPAPAVAPVPPPPPGPPPTGLGEVIAAVERKEGKSAINLPPELAAKLSPEQLVEVLADHERTRRESINRNDAESWLVPIAFFLTVLLSIAAVQLLGNRRDAVRQKTVQLMVEKGAAIPPELLGKAPRPASDLRRGLVLVGTGLGLALFLALLRADGMPGGTWSLGLLPGFIGLGYLGSWFVETRRRSAEGR